MGDSEASTNDELTTMVENIGDAVGEMEENMDKKLGEVMKELEDHMKEVKATLDSMSTADRSDATTIANHIFTLGQDMFNRPALTDYHRQELKRAQEEITETKVALGKVTWELTQTTAQLVSVKEELTETKAQVMETKAQLKEMRDMLKDMAEINSSVWQMVAENTKASGASLQLQNL
eukprot:g8402.t1